MKYFVVEPFTLETTQGIITLTTGMKLELSQEQAERLTGKVKLPLPNEGCDLPHYCKPGDCWCSQKLPDANYPAGCSKCEHYSRLSTDQQQNIG